MREILDEGIWDIVLWGLYVAKVELRLLAYLLWVVENCDLYLDWTEWDIQVKRIELNLMKTRRNEEG